MLNPNIPTSHQELQREFFDCPNCWGYQQYNKSEYNSLRVNADEAKYPRYVHLRTNSEQSGSDKQ